LEVSISNTMGRQKQQTEGSVKDCLAVNMDTAIIDDKLVHKESL